MKHEKDIIVYPKLALEKALLLKVASCTCARADSSSLSKASSKSKSSTLGCARQGIPPWLGTCGKCSLVPKCALPTIVIHSLRCPRPMMTKLERWYQTNKKQVHTVTLDQSEFWAPYGRLFHQCWSLVRILRGSKLGVEKIQGSGLKPPNSQVMSTKWEMLDVYSR